MSAAFQDYTAAKAAEYGLAGPCMSVGSAAILKDPSRMLDRFDATKDGVAWFLAGEVRGLKNAAGEDIGQGVMLDPTPEEEWHSVVFALGGRKKSGAMKSALSELAGKRWAIVPPRPQLGEAGT